MASHFVTGPTGFLGRYLVRALLERGDTVYALVRQAGALAELKARYPGTLHLLAGDVTLPKLGLDEATCRKLAAEQTHVWHLAACLSFRGSDKAMQYRTNVDGTRNVVALANGLGTALSHMSTVYVGGTKGVGLTEDVLGVKQSFHNNYERTKFLGEREVRRLCRVPCVIFRPSIIIGDAHVGKAEGCTFGYYRFTYVFYLFHQWIVRQLNSRSLAGVILRAAGTKHVDGLVRAPWLVVPYPRGTVVDLVPVNHVVSQMLARTKELRPAGCRTYHLTHSSPPLFIDSMKVALDDVGFREVHFAPMSPRAFRVLLLMAYYCLIPLRRYLRSARWYVPYITQTWSFKSSALPASVAVPPVDRTFLTKVNSYAINHVFNRSNLRRSLLA